MANKKLPKFNCCGEEKCEVDKAVKVYFCPKCNSCDVRYVFELRNLFGIIPKQKCVNCGNSDVVFPILVTSKKALARKKTKKTKTKLKKKNK